MSEDEDRKLQEIISRRITKDREIEDKQTAENLKKSQDEEKKQSARRKWDETITDIRAVVERLNADMKQSGISLDFDPGPPQGYPSLGLAVVHLDKNNRLLISVDAFGVVKPRIVIRSHTEDKPEFNILDVEPSHYRTLLIQFLDRAV